MLDSPVTDSLPSAKVEHLQGLEALPRVLATLARFEPAVLMSADGRGAIYAPMAGGSRGEREVWLLADSRTALEWEADRQHEVVLTFQSRDDRIYAQLSGMAELVIDGKIAGQLWRHSFARWFPGGPADPRLLVVRFAAASADFYECESGRVSAHLPH